MKSAFDCGARAARPVVLCLVAALAAAPLQAARAALPDEIQVYVDDLNDPGQLGLQEHINTTPVGKTEPDYPGEIVADHGVRFTSEFAYGVTRDLEAGAYLPFLVDAAGNPELAGFKLRLKWVPIKQPDEGSGIFAGLNGELSQVQRRFEDDTRAFELRPILGWRNSEWLFVVNPVLEFSLQGPDSHHAPAFSPQVKIARTVAPGIATGIEYYGELGPVTDFAPSGEQQHTLYWAVDIDRKPWNVNFGVGRGLTADTDRWTVKMIIDIPL